MTYSFNAPDEPGAPRPAVLPGCFVNRGIYQGWTAVTRHNTPWVVEPPAIDDDVWELCAPDDLGAWARWYNWQQRCRAPRAATPLSSVRQAGVQRLASGRPTRRTFLPGSLGGRP